METLALLSTFASGASLTLWIGGFLFGRYSIVLALILNCVSMLSFLVMSYLLLMGYGQTQFNSRYRRFAFIGFLISAAVISVLSYAPPFAFFG
jgi:hypothetical protein